MMPLYAAGVEQLCTWLLGTQSDRPIPIPIRGEDGQLLTFEQRRDAATAAQPYKNWGPEERHALHNKIDSEIARDHRLLARLDEMKKQAYGN